MLASSGRGLLGPLVKDGKAQGLARSLRFLPPSCFPHILFLPLTPQSHDGSTLCSLQPQPLCSAFPETTSPGNSPSRRLQWTVGIKGSQAVAGTLGWGGQPGRSWAGVGTGVLLFGGGEWPKCRQPERSQSPLSCALHPLPPWASSHTLHALASFSLSLLPCPRFVLW